MQCVTGPSDHLFDGVHLHLMKEKRVSKSKYFLLFMVVASFQTLLGQDLKQERVFKEGFSQAVLIEIIDDGIDGYFFMRNLTLPERILVYNLLPPDLQEELWLNHIKQYVLERNALLSENEHAVIEDLVSLILRSHVFYRGVDFLTEDHSYQESMNAIQERLWGAFKMEAYEIVGVLGGTPTGSEFPDQIYLPCEDRHDCMPCSCKTDTTNYCIGHPRRCWWEMYCSPTESGCGNLWLQACDGECGLEPDIFDAAPGVRQR